MKKRIFLLLCSLGLVLSLAVPTTRVLATDGAGGQITMDGRVTFYEESTEPSTEPSSSTSSSSSTPGKIPDTGGKLPSTGEMVQYGSLFAGGLLLLLLLLFLWRRKKKDEEEQS